MCSKCSFIRLATNYLFNKFGYERKVRNRTIILHIFLIQPRSLKQRGYDGSFQTQWHHIIGSAVDLLAMTVISGRTRSTYFFETQVGSGSKSHDLFGGLVIISLISTSEAGRNISSIFPLNIISAFVQILQVLLGESEMILFLMIIEFLMNKLLNLSARSSAYVKYVRFTF